MIEEEERALFESYSRGEMTRTELERRLGRDLDFADALLKLRAYGLPLPHPPSDPNSPGVQLIRRLASRDTRSNTEGR